MSHHQLIIIGSGPAGLTAAIYAARADLKPLVIEGIEAGGQLMQTTEVENYPGFADGIMGPELMMVFRDQAERFGSIFLTDEVTQVDLAATPKRIVVSGDEYTADAVIITTGAKARMIGLEREQIMIGHGVSTCATCDGFFFRGKEIVVIGGGDSAMEEALFLTKFASRVTVVHRSDQYRASRIMLDRAKAHEKIKFVEHARVVDLVGERELSAVVIEDLRTSERHELPAEGMFVAIGHIPSTELFAGQLAMDEGGYLITGQAAPAVTSTNIAGVFAAGDVQDHRYRQAATSVGSGCMAAIDAEQYLAHG